MLEKQVGSPSAPDDSANTATEDPPPETKETLRSTDASGHLPPNPCTLKPLAMPDQIEHSDGGTSSSTSTLSTSSTGRRSKSRDSRHSSEEVIGEEESELEFSEDELKTKQQTKTAGQDKGGVHPSIFEENQIPDEKDYLRMDERVAVAGVVSSSDVDSAFEDQPLVGRVKRNKKRMKQRKASSNSAKSNKIPKPPLDQSVVSRPSSFRDNIEFSIPPQYFMNEVMDTHGEPALFKMDVSPVLGYPEMMEESNELLLYAPPSVQMEEDHLLIQSQMEDEPMGMDSDGNPLSPISANDKLIGGDVDHQPELLFLSHLLEDKDADDKNPGLPLNSKEISGQRDLGPNQPIPLSQSLPENDGVELSPEEGIEYDVEWVPPDGGWGWLVLLGSILVNILIPGTVKSFGVLFIEFIEVFNTTPAAASWIPALSYWLYSSIGPFSTALAIKFSHRSVTIAGGILAASGLMLSYFANSIEFLYVSYGLIGGLGAGLAYPIGIIIVGQYFRKRIGLANGLCTSGSALGSVLMPPLLRYLLVDYGYRGAILILGAILLNVCVAAMFYDPVEKHLKKVLTPRRVIPIPETVTTGVGLPPRGKSPVTNNVNIRKHSSSPLIREVAMSMPIAIPVPNPREMRDVRDRRGSGSIKKATFQIGNETPVDSWSLRSNDGASPLAARLQKEDPASPKMYHNSNLRTRPFPCSLDSTSEMENLFNAHLNVSSGGASTHASNAASRSKLNLTAIPEDDDTTDCESRNLDWSYYRNLTPVKQRLMRLSAGAGNQVVTSSSQPQITVPNNKGLSRTLSTASNVSNSSFHYVSTIHHGSLLMTMQFDKTCPDFASTLTIKSVRHSCWKCWVDLPKRLFRKCGLCPKWTADTTDHTRIKITDPSWSKFIDFSLLKDGVFIIMLLSSATTAIGYTNFIILLPAYSLSIGFDKSDASMLLSIVAAFDFVGRIGGAALSDLVVNQRKWFYILGLLGSGISLALLPISKDYWPLVTFCSIFGLTSGIYIGVTAVILADQLGKDRLGSSYGLSLFLNGLVQLVGPPICGSFLEYLKSYDPIFIALGLSLVLGSAIWIFTPFIERRRRKKQAELDAATEELNAVFIPNERVLQHVAVRRLKESEAV